MTLLTDGRGTTTGGHRGERATGDRPRRGPSTTARIGRLGLGFLLPLGLLLGWDLAVRTGAVSTSVLPGPGAVWSAMTDLAADGTLGRNTAISVQRVLLGFALGSVLAVVVGLLTGLSRIADALVSPTLAAVRAVPSLAWVPLLILWVGISELPKVVMCAIGAFFPVLAALVAGIRAVDPAWRELARANGLGRVGLVRRVLLPAAAPPLMTGLRLGLAQAWLFLVAAELVGSSLGLGFQLVDSQNTGRVTVLVGTIVLLGLLGKLSDVVLGAVERAVTARLR